MSFYNVMHGEGGAIKIDYLIVGGGGGSGGATVTNYISGGGGAGGVAYGKTSLYFDNSYTVTVGSAGLGGIGDLDGSDGNSSGFYNMSVTGGGGGGAGVGSVRNGRAGASGGGGRGAGAVGGAGTSLQGFDGGGVGAGLINAAGGGGGSATIGQSVVKSNYGGGGGDGISSDITGTSRYYAGGGGGGGIDQDGQGGLGGGGGRMSVASHDFFGTWTYDEGATADPSRWDNQQTFSMTDIGSLGAVVLHGYSPRTTYTITHSQLPTHSQARYQVYWHCVDSLDSEYSTLTINGELFADFRKQGYLAQNQGEPTFYTNRMATSKWVRAEYSYAPWSTATGIFAAPGYIVFDTGWIDHTSTTFTASHYFGADQAQSDEAMYLSHVKIQTRQPKGAMTVTSPPSDWNFLHNGTTNWTMECWFNAPYTTPLSEGTMFYTTGSGYESGFWLGLNDPNSWSGDATATVELYIMAGGAWCVWSTPANSWTPNVWNHMAVTFNASTKVVNIFTNGIAKSLTKTPSLGWYDVFSSGSPPRTLQLGSGFAGSIFNWRIVKSIVYTSNFTPTNRVLPTIANTVLNVIGKAPGTTQDLSGNYNIDNSNEVGLSTNLPFNLTGSTVDDPDCVAHFIVNGNRTAIADSVSNAALTVSNAAFSKIPTTNINGIKVGGSNGTGYVSETSAPRLQLASVAGSSYTITAWVYRTGPGTYPTWGGIIINKDTEYEVCVRQDGFIAVAINWSGSGWVVTPVSIPLYQAIHVAVVIDNTVMKIYTNGSLQYTKVDMYRVAEPTNNPVVIGNRPGNSQQFDGYIGDVQIWKRALTVSQISALMSSSAAGIAGDPNTGGGAGGLGTNTDTIVAIGTSDGKSAAGPKGQDGGNPIDISGLFAIMVASGYPVGIGGTGASQGSSESANVNHGGGATGVGGGGGGAGYYGGNGGGGTGGGGGGGAAGYTGVVTGGTGGAGLIFIQRVTNGTTTNERLASGSTYTIPANTTSMKVWVIGGGGGGAGSPAEDISAGGGGGAGGCAYKTWTSPAAGTATMVLGASGTAGSGANNGANGSDTYFTYNGTTITGKAGSGGYYNNGTRAPGGKYTITGDTSASGGAAGGSGGGSFGDQGGGGGGGLGSTLNVATGYPGGSGVVVIRHETKYALTPIVTGDPIITTAGIYRVYQWNSSGSVIFKTNRTVNYLIVAGGGGGGAFGGGGGGGGVLSGSYGFSMAESIVITVGSGGAESPYYGTGSNGNNGENSSISASTATFTAIGGGGGGTRGWYYDAFTGHDANSGGSGGGGSPSDTGHQGQGGAGIIGQGNNGGAGGTPQSWAGGGGGGAGGTGGDGSGGGYSGIGGNGGAGIGSSITGSLVYYAGGGGGCVYVVYSWGTTGGVGGIGGGGTGAKGYGGNQGAPTAGEANTGGGGGGGPAPGVGSAGGSGVVILSYPDSYPDPSAVTGSPETTTSGGNKIYKFVNSGTITF